MALKITWCVILVGVGGLLTTPSPLVGEVHQTNRSGAQVVIPPELEYARRFVKLLQSAGLVVRNVQPSMLGGMFQGVETAASVSTNLGVVEVVIFNGPHDAEQITVTYSKKLGAPAWHYYTFQGWPTNGGAGRWEGLYPEYITLHGNWFIRTLEPSLDTLLKRSLGQATAPIVRQ